MSKQSCCPRPKGGLCRRPPSAAAVRTVGTMGTSNGKASLYPHQNQHLQVSCSQHTALNAARVFWFESSRTSVVSGTNAIFSLCSQLQPQRLCLGGHAVAPVSLCPALPGILPPPRGHHFSQSRPSVPRKTQAGLLSRGKRTKDHQEEEQ